MFATKLNVNIRTLLANCEELSKDEANNWRLKKFIKSLETMLAELSEYEDAQSTAKIPEYKRRLQSLKTLTNYIDSPTSANRQRISGMDAGDSAIKEVRQLQNSKQDADLRRELLHEGAVRQRKPENGIASSGGDNIGEVKFYNDTQEKITEHMISLTRNLREQTETANRIIKKDTETVTSSAGMTERNIDSLHKESAKLEDHSRNAWKCWMWLMIMFVIVTFIVMVLFMKIMKKKAT